MLFPAHYTEVVQVGSVTSGVTMVMDRGWAFRCSLNLSPNVLAVSPIHSSSHSNLSHLNLYIMPLLFVMWSLSFGATSSSFKVFACCQSLLYICLFFFQWLLVGPNVLAMCNSVLIMLYLLVMAWWLSHCKY